MPDRSEHGTGGELGAWDGADEVIGVEDADLVIVLIDTDPLAGEAASGEEAVRSGQRGMATRKREWSSRTVSCSKRRRRVAPRIPLRRATKIGPAILVLLSPPLPSPHSKLPAWDRPPPSLFEGFDSREHRAGPVIRRSTEIAGPISLARKESAVHLGATRRTKVSRTHLFGRLPKLNFLAIVLQVLPVPFLQCVEMPLHFTLQNSTELVERFAREALEALLKAGSVL
jgi:hypothetical protein